MLKDRGSKKWTAMMLTEHVKDIREWYESGNDIPEPQYDEFSLNALADELNIAFQTRSTVQINYWGNKRAEKYEGQIIELLPNEQVMKLRTNEFNILLHLKYVIKLDIFN